MYSNSSFVIFAYFVAFSMSAHLFIYLFKVNLPNKQVRFLMSITYILGL